MASPLPFVLLGAAFLLMRGKGGGNGKAAGSPDTSKAAGDAPEHKPKAEPWKEGDPIPEEWIPAPVLADGVQRYFKPVVEMQMRLDILPGAEYPDGTPYVPDDAPDAPPEPPPVDPGVDEPVDEADVPPGSYCADVANWNPEWVALEEAMLTAVNQLRASGYGNCAEGPQSSAPPLTMNPHLRCSARKHSKDMALKNYFSHTNQEGQESWDRMWAAGFDGLKASENITAGPGTATVQGAMQNFLTSTQGHCEALFDPAMTEVGIGLYQHGSGYKFYWTQNFGG